MEMEEALLLPGRTSARSRIASAQRSVAAFAASLAICAVLLTAQLAVTAPAPSKLQQSTDEDTRSKTCDDAQAPIRLHLLAGSGGYRTGVMNPTITAMLDRVLHGEYQTVEYQSKQELISALSAEKLCAGDMISLGGVSFEDTCNYQWTNENPLLLPSAYYIRAVLGYKQPLQILWSDAHCQMDVPATHHTMYRLGTPTGHATLQGKPPIPYGCALRRNVTLCK